MKFISAFLTGLMLYTPVMAQNPNADRSVIGIKVKVPLSGLEALLGQSIPAQINQRPTRHVCVKAERACTKIPEFRGLKIYSRMECIDVTPRITCDLSGQATREGPFKLTGSGSTLTAKQVIRVSATARGRGVIGKNIRQTARGALAISLSTTPRIDSNWTIKSNPDIDYRWTRPLTVKLFNLIPVTIRGEVESTLNRQIAKIKNGSADAALAELGLKDKMQALWDASRRPVELDLGLSADPLYLHVQPHGIAASDLSFANGIGEISLQLFGRTFVTHQGASPWPTQAALPDLGKLPSGVNDFQVSVPLRLDWSTVNQMLSTQLPVGLPIKQPFAGEIIVKSALLQSSDGALKLRLDVGVKPASRLLPDLSGNITLSAVPGFDTERRILTFDEIALVDSSSSALQAVVTLAQNLGLIANQIKAPLDSDITQLESSLRRRLNFLPLEGVKGVKSQGDIAVRFDSLKVGLAGLTLTARAKGNLTMSLELVP